MVLSLSPIPTKSNHREVQRLARAGIRRFCPRGGPQNSPFREYDYIIPYVVGKLAPNSSYLTRRLVKYVPGRGYFRAVSSQNGDKCVTFPPRPPIVERVRPERFLLRVTSPLKAFPSYDDA